jgi:hypothetical protein
MDNNMAKIKRKTSKRRSKTRKNSCLPCISALNPSKKGTQRINPNNIENQLNNLLNSEVIIQINGDYSTDTTIQLKGILTKSKFPNKSHIFSVRIPNAFCNFIIKDVETIVTEDLDIKFEIPKIILR